MNTNLSVSDPGAAERIILSQERREANESALSMMTKQLKLQLGSELKAAKKARNEAEEKARTLRSKLYGKAAEVALVQLLDMDVARRILAFIEDLGGVEVTATQLWDERDIRVDLSRKNRAFSCSAEPYVSFSIEVEVDEHTTRSAESGRITWELSADHPELRGMFDEWAAAADALTKAGEHFAACEKRLDGLGEASDVAEVELRRVHLQSMGDMGGKLLEKVDGIMKAASGDGNYLALLGGAK